MTHNAASTLACARNFVKEWSPLMKKGLMAMFAVALCSTLMVPSMAFAAPSASASSVSASYISHGTDQKPFHFLWSFIAEHIDTLCGLIERTDAPGPNAAVALSGNAASAGTPVMFGPNCIDEDGDGVCDYYAEGYCEYGNCPRGTYGQHHYYIDEDGDGVCDHYANGMCDRSGHHGYGGGQGYQGGSSAPANPSYGSGHHGAGHHGHRR